ncbi:MAG: histidine kinase dimerization/phospho-acceptor domain-containing protein [Sphingomicrobium sp.]
MRFDDRLMTVLDQPASDPHDRAVRWRQLVDLVARAGGQADNPLVEQALQLIRADRANVDDSLRSAAARAVAALPLPYELVALFASDKLAVSAPLLAATRLEPHEWQRLLSVADDETRQFVATLHPDIPAAPPAVSPTPEEPFVEGAAPASQAIPSISDVVARIERLRHGQEQPPASPPADGQRRPVATSAPTLFRWECGPSGEIAWVEGAPRGPLIGRSIARAEEGEGVDDEVVRAFATRAPFRDAQLSLPGEGILAGAWKISGVPAFEPADGRFAGYRGIALREANGGYDAALNGLHPLLSDPNSLRELVHEIKTPLNAIIGFAEIIDSQLLGPADRQYRTRAAEIVAQAKLLLSAIDDLDFAAKLQADRNRPGSGTDLATLLEQLAVAMRQGASASAPHLQLSIETRKRRCALEPALAERLVTRFCDAVFAAAADGEQIVVHIDNRSGRCLLWVHPPPQLGTGDGDQGGGFGLRLVRGLARIAGGDLTITKARITLALPEL